MAELKEIETKDKGGMSSVRLARTYQPFESNHDSQIPIFALHRASTGPRRIDLCLGVIQHAQTRDFFCRPLFWLISHE
jgi:hypothetical protein